MNNLTSTQALIKLIEIETELLALSQKLQSENRAITTEKYVMDDEMGELADRFWSIASCEGENFSSEVIKVINEVKALGYEIDKSGEWEYIRGAYSTRLYLDACNNGMNENEEVELLPGL